MTFADLGLGPEILKALAEKGYEKPTPIQEKAIPAVLMTRDIIALAQTGTGKTAGFTLPMIEILAQGRAKMRMPRSLVLSPTRELAAQISENFATYGKYHNLNHVLLVGGESMAEQMKVMEKGVDVLIATPGRMMDLFERGHILLTDIKILVIDEADRMLDMGFIPDIEKIVSFLPPMCQRLLFSATMPPEIEKLANKFLHNPKTIKVDPPASPAETVSQNLVWVPERSKRAALKKLIAQEDVKNAFVFCNRKTEVSALARWLTAEGFKAAPMHGDMAQPVRTKTLQEFKDGTVILMVCSDVAARGLDVQAVSHVFNYDVPFNAEDYVHRIGRTGRAGMKGQAWTFAVPDEDDRKCVQAIEKLTGRPIPVTEMERFSAARPAAETDQDKKRPAARGRKPTAGTSGSKGRRDAPESPARAKAAPPIRAHGNVRPLPARKAAERRPAEDADQVLGFGDDLPAFLR